MNLDWLQNSLDEELEEGNIYGYVTDGVRDVQLKNYMEEQGFPVVVELIREKYQMIAILTNMYVNDEHRGSGIGTSLLENFIDKAYSKNVEAIVLVADTSDSNEFDLVEWYETYDFKIIYGKKESFPVMIKELN